MSTLGGQMAIRPWLPAAPSAIARASSNDGARPFIFQFPAIKGTGAVIQPRLAASLWTSPARLSQAVRHVTRLPGGRALHYTGAHACGPMRTARKGINARRHSPLREI